MTHESNSNRQENNEVQESRRNGELAVWISIGTGIGVALGVSLENLALGIAIGAAIGVVIGSAANTGRMGGEMRDAGTPGRRWICAIAAVSGLLLLVGMIILFELMTG
jgi:hypothetical protein